MGINKLMGGKKMSRSGERGSILWAILGIVVLTTVTAVTYVGYSNFIKQVAPPSSTPFTGTTYSPGGSTVAPGSLYVAMGDSYSSGQGSDRTATSPAIDF